MLKLKVIKVSNKVRNLESGETFVLIETNAGAISRSHAQFKTDLEGSHIGADTDAQLSEAMYAITSGTATFDGEIHKAGDEYEVHEYSGCITNENHPDYGKYAIGDMVKCLKNGFTINGFITFTKNMRVEMATAKAKTMSNADYASLFDEGIDDVHVDGFVTEADVVVVDDVDARIKAEADAIAKANAEAKAIADADKKAKADAKKEADRKAKANGVPA